MKSEMLLKELNIKENVWFFKDTDNKIIEDFKNKYDMFKDKFFYDQFINSGGFIVDNWIRIYGCGILNVVEKNILYNKDNYVDILIGEDILGGLFALKNEYVYYYAPDSNEWENLEIYYTQFLNWILNSPDNVNKFYQYFRWNNWKKDCKNIKITEGILFYPLLQFEYDIEKRSKKVISIDELIRLILRL